MSVEISISCVVMEYHHCPFKVKKGKVFSISKKRGELREEREGRTEETEASLAISKPILSPHFIHIKWIFPHKYSKRRNKTVCGTVYTNHTTANTIDVNHENQ